MTRAAQVGFVDIAMVTKGIESLSITSPKASSTGSSLRAKPGLGTLPSQLVSLIGSFSDPQSMYALVLTSKDCLAAGKNMLLGNHNVVKAIFRKVDDKVSGIPEPLRSLVIASVKQSKMLDISGIELTDLSKGEQVINELVANFKDDLEQLNLSNSPDLTDDHLQLLDFPKLRVLNVSGCCLSASMKHLAKLPSLQELIADKRADDSTLEDIPAHKPQLTRQ